MSSSKLTTSGNFNVSDGGPSSYGSLKFTDNKVSTLQTPRRALGDVKNVGVTPIPSRIPPFVKNSSVPSSNTIEEAGRAGAAFSKGCSKFEQPQIQNEQLSASELQFRTVDPDASPEKFTYEQVPDTLEDIAPDPERRLEVDQLFYNIITDEAIVRQLFLEILSEESYNEIKKDNRLPEEDFLKKIIDQGSYSDTELFSRAGFI